MDDETDSIPTNTDDVRLEEGERFERNIGSGKTLDEAVAFLEEKAAGIDDEYEWRVYTDEDVLSGDDADAAVLQIYRREKEGPTQYKKYGEEVCIVPSQMIDGFEGIVDTMIERAIEHIEESRAEDGY